MTGWQIIFIALGILAAIALAGATKAGIEIWRHRNDRNDT